MHDDRLGDGLADALARIEAGERILKNHLHALAQLAQGFRIERADILPVKEYAPFARLDQPQDRAAGRRFAAAELADERQRLAGVQREGHVLDRMHAGRRPAEDSRADGKAGDEIGDFKERALVGTKQGLLARLNPILGQASSAAISGSGNGFGEGSPFIEPRRGTAAISA